MDISDGLGVDCGRLAAASGCALVIELADVPLAEGAEIGDLGFGEDYELLAAVAEPGRFPVVGRCAAGAGVTFLRDGQPAELAGWQHFT